MCVCLLIDSDFRQKTRDAINQLPQVLKHYVGDDRHYTNNLIFQLPLQASPHLSAGLPLGSALPSLFFLSDCFHLFLGLK